jgi:hypothetical protein
MYTHHGQPSISAFPFSPSPHGGALCSDVPRLPEHDFVQSGTASVQRSPHRERDPNGEVFLQEQERRQSSRVKLHSKVAKKERRGKEHTAICFFWLSHTLSHSLSLCALLLFVMLDSLSQGSTYPDLERAASSQRQLRRVPRRAGIMARSSFAFWAILLR